MNDKEKRFDQLMVDARFQLAHWRRCRAMRDIYNANMCDASIRAWESVLFYDDETREAEQCRTIGESR